MWLDGTESTWPKAHIALGYANPLFASKSLGPYAIYILRTQLPHFGGIDEGSLGKHNSSEDNT